MVATLSSSLPFLTTIPSLHRPFVTSIAPSSLFRGKGLNFCSARKLVAHFPRRSFRTNPVEETPGDGGAGGEGSADQPTVSVPVSASDTLSMFFQLTEQTTIQATGVASGLAETIQGAGFKLQTLNLSFDDQEEVLLS